MSKSHYQGNLFSDQAGSETIVVKRDGLEIEYQPSFLEPELASSWFDRLLHEVNWQQDTITVYGKKHLTPRLSCWMGEPWMAYSYSNHTMQPHSWQALPLAIKRRIEGVTGERFNSVLINYYRDGKDSNGWHADDEPELGSNPTIASLSLGGTRDFHLRRNNEHADKVKLSLEHGSLLMMRGHTQGCWQHQVPKRASAAARVNLTFRTIRLKSSQRS